MAGPQEMLRGIQLPEERGVLPPFLKALLGQGVLRK